MPTVKKITPKFKVITDPDPKLASGSVSNKHSQYYKTNRYTCTKTCWNKPFQAPKKKVRIPKKQSIRENSKPPIKLQALFKEDTSAPLVLVEINRQYHLIGL